LQPFTYINLPILIVKPSDPNGKALEATIPRHSRRITPESPPIQRRSTNRILVTIEPQAQQSTPPQ
ncbi:hypothetical protein AAEP93_008371, partial [Penicillium crustosum]